MSSESSCPEPAPDRTTALFDVYVLDRAVADLLTTALAGSPMTATDYAIVGVLHGEPGRSPSELARRFATPLTTMSDMLMAIERRGHVRRVERPTDRRSHGLELTAAGLEAFEVTRTAFCRAYTSFLDELDIDEGEVRRHLQAAIRAARVAREALGSVDDGHRAVGV